MVEHVREVVIERHGDLKLVVGGKHGYVRVRGGNTKDEFTINGWCARSTARNQFVTWSQLVYSE